MSFWQRIWTTLNTDIEVNWTETTKGGIEASKQVFELAAALNKKENQKVLDLSPFLKDTASLLDVLNSPLGEVAKSSIPFVGMAATLLGYIIEQSQQESTIEGCIFILIQGAYLESFKSFLRDHPEIACEIKEKKASQEVTQKLKDFGKNFRLDNKSAKDTLVSFWNSDFATEANEILKYRLIESGFSEEKAKIITQRIAMNTHRCLKDSFIEIQDKVPILKSVYGQKWQEELERYHSLDQYLEWIEEQPTQLIFEDQFRFDQLYVPLKVKSVINGEVDEEAEAFKIEEWATKLLLNESKKNQVLFIQGRPGGGKSVFCRMFADKVRQELYPIYIPIVIRLRDIEDFSINLDQTLSNAIKWDFVTSDSGWLTDPNIRYLFFLDGFDELILERGKGNDLTYFLDQVSLFQKSCAENAERGHRVIITGRPFALYGIERKMPHNLEWVNLELMDKEIQKQWLNQWQGCINDEAEVNNFKAFLDDQDCPKDVKQLAQEPLLLYLLASLHQDQFLSLDLLKSGSANSVKVTIYRQVIEWVLTKQRERSLNLDLTQLDTEDLKEVLKETGLCVTQTGKERAFVRMIENRLIEKGDTEAADLIKTARDNKKEYGLKNALCAFYIKAVTGKDNQVEFFHKSFGEYLMAERLVESLAAWTVKEGRKPRFKVKEGEFDWQVYDLLGYGHLTLEVLGYLMPLLTDDPHPQPLSQGRGENKDFWLTLYQRLNEFYLRWSQGEFIEAYDDILPLKKAKQLKEYEGEMGQRTVDIYTGLNVLKLLLIINQYAQQREDLKEEIYFHPCGNPDNKTEFDKSRLFKIMGYADCLERWTFNRQLGKFLNYANLRNADLSYADLSYAHLSYAHLSYAHLSYAHLSYAHLSKADLSNADLFNAHLSKADLSNADLSNADLRYAHLSKADLSYADLSYAHLSNAHLSNADLSNADLSKADLSKADLSNADLSNAHLSKADLSNADLSNADLSNADLSNADLRYANLEGIQWNEDTNWEGVMGLETARNVPFEL